MIDNDFKSEFLNNYLLAALWSSFDEQENPLDANYDISDFSPESIKKAEQDCERFIKENTLVLEDIDYHCNEYTNADLAGHDFWLTRNGHGVGFWDRGLDGDMGQILTAYSRNVGVCDCYAGDDNLLYLS